jgi:hypothetical protein
LKHKEVLILKKKIKNLIQQHQDLKELEKVNDKLRGRLTDSETKYKSLLLEFEEGSRRREEQLTEYKDANDKLLLKLDEMNRCNAALRSAYDDTYEKLENYKEYLNGKNDQRMKCLKGEINVPLKKQHSEEAKSNVFILGDEDAKGLGIKLNSRLDKMCNKTRAADVKQTRVRVMGDETAKGLGSKLRSRLNSGVECWTKPGSILENMVGDICQSIKSASLNETIILLTGKNENYKNPRNYLKHLESIIKVATEKKVTVYLNSIKYIKHTKVNSLIYRINSLIYNMTISSSNVHIIETNCKNRLWEQIPVLLKFTAHKIPTCIAICTNVDYSMESPTQQVGSPMAGLSRNPSMGSSFSGRGRRPPWP